MKKQIIAGMLVLVLLILPASLYVQIDRSFRQNLENARDSALREESAIARGLSLEMQRDDGNESKTTVRRVAWDAQKR